MDTHSHSDIASPTVPIPLDNLGKSTIISQPFGGLPFGIGVILSHASDSLSDTISPIVGHVDDCALTSQHEGVSKDLRTMSKFWAYMVDNDTDEDLRIIEENLTFLIFNFSAALTL